MIERIIIKMRRRQAKQQKKKNTTCAYSHMVSCTRMEIRQLSLFTLFFFSSFYSAGCCYTMTFTEKTTRFFNVFFGVTANLFWCSVFIDFLIWQLFELLIFFFSVKEEVRIYLFFL